MGVTLSPEQTAQIEEAGRPLAILWGMDRPSATEKSYLRLAQGSGRGRGLSEEESCLAQHRRVNHDDIIQTGFP